MAKHSDGSSDGFFILYKHEGKIYPTAIEKDKLELIGFILGELTVVKDIPLNVKTIKLKKKEERK